MPSLTQLLPAAPELLKMQPEEIAPMLLEYFNQFGTHIHHYNVFIRSGELGSYAGQKYEQVANALEEAWMVLEREGLIAHKPEDSNGQMYFITRRGQNIRSRQDFSSYLKANLLPDAVLDPVLAEKVRPLFLGGDYDTAVFRAFREVEVRIRQAAKLPDDLIGTKLIRRAFDVNQGPLSDMTKVESEREATQHLFAGAIGTFKNPSSHRDVTYDPREAASIINFANYLISWVERIK